MTNATTSVLEATAEELSGWFARVAQLSGEAFGWRRDPHGNAAAIHVLRRQAARLRSSRLATDGGSYTALCLFLAAACRALRCLDVGPSRGAKVRSVAGDAPALGTELTSRHWMAALRNVVEQRDIAGAESLGVALGSPAERFKMLLDDAIDAAGLGPQVTMLDEKNQKLALGLAVNWGLRTLLAYAVETKLPKSATAPERQDLAWLRGRVRRLRPGA